VKTKSKTKCKKAVLDIWKVKLVVQEHLVKQAQTILCSEERKRADRLLSARAKCRFILAHAASRIILSRYLGIDAKRVVIKPGKNGKPGLSGAAARTGICFNLSHSADIALVGISENRDIGIDIEQVRPVFSMDKICRRFFAESEIRMLASAPEDMRTGLFFRLWTMKEAFLKAEGKGLQGLFRMPPIIGDAGITGFLNDPWKTFSLSASGRTWTVIPFCPAPGYSAAVVLSGKEPYDMVVRDL